MARITFLLAIVSLIALPLTASATDGDVVYSAPYIWVNPETGQIEMKNPGPQPKAHPNMSTETPVAMFMAAEEVEGGSGDHGTAAEGEAVAHTNPIHPMIVIAGMIAVVSLIVVMGRKS